MVSSAARTGTNRCTQCSQVAACPWPEPHRGLRRARKQRRCSSVSGEHRPPCTAELAPRLPPSCGLTCIWGSPLPLRTRHTCSLTSPGRRALQNPQHNAPPEAERARACWSPPPSAGGNRTGPGGGRCGRGARGASRHPAQPGGQREGLPRRGLPPGRLGHELGGEPSSYSPQCTGS